MDPARDPDAARRGEDGFIGRVGQQWYPPTALPVAHTIAPEISDPEQQQRSQRLFTHLPVANAIAPQAGVERAPAPCCGGRGCNHCMNGAAIAILRGARTASPPPTMSTSRRYINTQWDASARKWRAILRPRHAPPYCLGYFDREADAARTADVGALRCWGRDEADLNFPGGYRLVAGVWAPVAVTEPPLGVAAAPDDDDDGDGDERFDGGSDEDVVGGETPHTVTVTVTEDGPLLFVVAAETAVDGRPAGRPRVQRWTADARGAPGAVQRWRGPGGAAVQLGDAIAAIDGHPTDGVAMDDLAELIDRRPLTLTFERPVAEARASPPPASPASGLGRKRRKKQDDDFLYGDRARRQAPAPAPKRRRAAAKEGAPAENRRIRLRRLPAVAGGAGPSRGDRWEPVEQQRRLPPGEAKRGVRAAPRPAVPAGATEARERAAIVGARGPTPAAIAAILAASAAGKEVCLKHGVCTKLKGHSGAPRGVPASNKGAGAKKKASPVARAHAAAAASVARECRFCGRTMTCSLFMLEHHEGGCDGKHGEEDSIFDSEDDKDDEDGDESNAAAGVACGEQPGGRI